MSNEIKDKAGQAEARTQETRGFIRRVKHNTRRKFTTEEKIRILLEGIRHEVPVRELCRREGIHPNVYYSWLKHFMEAGKERLKHDTARDATRAEVEELKRQNRRLKELVAELSLEVHLLKKKRPYLASRSEEEICEGEGKPQGVDPGIGGLISAANHARPDQAAIALKHLLPVAEAAG